MKTPLVRDPVSACLHDASKRALLAASVSLGLLALPGCASLPSDPVPPGAKAGFVDIGSGMQLRHLVVRPAHPKGVVLFLHGFPETAYAWKEISLDLGKDYEVHAFDWPGYGLSSRPPAEQFGYAPKDYASVLSQYIRAAGIDRSKLVIYATDIGALPALLAALDDPGIAKSIVVGDFAPLDRPQYMYPSLQSLKVKASAEATRAYMNKTSEEILKNAYRRGLAKEEQFDIPAELEADMFKGWNQGSMTSADAFYHYYSQFTRDQNELEANISRLRTPIRVVWGEKDLYIKPEMGAEFARKSQAAFRVLPGLGHYPHLQRPKQTAEEVRAVLTM
ncbi:alpha/beta fold hydrolase [Ideonella sp. YS5]|uniref:alpha/beta fold hydrolase n=1 Tax=Ideonella sp. YS5 TaxID=3453714 RepID=UPI003EED6DE1